MISLLTALLFISCTGVTTRSEEIVRFESEGVTLEGVLNLPDKPGKRPLVIFVHGSGKTTREDYVEFVDPLLSEGFATFRYDKRGVGASGGTYSGIGTKNSPVMIPLLASDAVAAIKKLRTHSRIDSDRVIIMGASQAGWIIPEVVANAKTWLSVCISGPSVTIGEENYYSDLAEKGAYSVEDANKMMSEFRGTPGYDPIENIKKMKRPSLWMFGGMDNSIPVPRSIEILEKIKSEEKLPITIKLYLDANHGMFNIGKGQFEDYRKYAVEWVKNKVEN